MLQKKDSKQFILIEAFKLFTSNQYDKVTFSKLEAATNFSRGAILYHFKSKEVLFEAVVKEFVLNRSTISSIVFKNNSFLEDVSDILNLFIDEQNKFKQMKISNINLAYFIIECSALMNLPQAQVLAAKWFEKDTNTWKTLILNAIDRGEIRKDVNADATATLFSAIYMGVSYQGIAMQNGYDMKQIEKSFKTIYDLIKLK